MKLHKETQRCHRVEAFLLVGLFFVLSLAFCIKLILNTQIFSISMLMIGLGIVVVTSCILYYLLALRVDLSISESSIKYKYKLYPFVSEKKKIKWKDVEEAQVIETSFGSSLSGWGVHYNTMEKRVSVNGCNGLALRLKNGKSIFLGSQNLSSLRSALSNLDENQQVSF